MNLIDEEDLVLLELGEGSDHVAGPLDGGAGGGLDADAELGGDDVGEGGLAESGRAVEEDVVEGLSALPCGDDGYLKIALNGLLSDVVDESTRPQGVVDVFGLFLGGYDAFLHVGECLCCGTEGWNARTFVHSRFGWADCQGSGKKVERGKKREEGVAYDATVGVRGFWIPHFASLRSE